MATDLEGLTAQLQSLAELATKSVGDVQTPEE
jgi:phenylalanyl-tRNA synthetase alpha chain